MRVTHSSIARKALAAEIREIGELARGGADDPIFDVLSTIAARLETDPDAVQVELDRLEAPTAGVRSGRAAVGARGGREDVDRPQTIMEMHLQQTAYRAALATGARVVQPSLIDFLR